MTELENKILLTEFPYLDPENSDGWAYGNSDNINWYNNVDFGWRELFINMLREINGVLDEYNLPYTNLHIEQVKEKYGTLRFYYFLEGPIEADEKIYKIVDRYEDLSEVTCINCGCPATVLSAGWICPYCDDCIENKEIYQKL